MSALEKIAAVIFMFGIGAAGGSLAAYYTTSNGLGDLSDKLLRESAERTEAQISFSEPGQVEINYVTFIRGQRVRCTVWADPRRKVFSTMC